MPCCTRRHHCSRTSFGDAQRPRKRSLRSMCSVLCHHRATPRKVCFVLHALLRLCSRRGRKSAESWPLKCRAMKILVADKVRTVGRSFGHFASSARASYLSRCMRHLGVSCMSRACAGGQASETRALPSSICRRPWERRCFRSHCRA